MWIFDGKSFGSGDSGWKNLDPGSGLNIPDPQHCHGDRCYIPYFFQVCFWYAADLIKTADSLIQERYLDPLIPNQQVPQRLPVHRLVEGRLDQLCPPRVQRAVNGRAQGKVPGIGLTWRKNRIYMSPNYLFFFWPQCLKFQSPYIKETGIRIRIRNTAF